MCAQYPLFDAAIAPIIAYYSILSHAVYVFVNLICPLALPSQEAFKIIYSKFDSQHLISSPTQVPNENGTHSHMRLINESYKISEFLLKL